MWRQNHYIYADNLLFFWGREDDGTQLKCTLLMKCHKGMIGYSRDTLCDKLGLSPRTIGGLLSEIPDGIDMSNHR